VLNSAFLRHEDDIFVPRTPARAMRVQCPLTINRRSAHCWSHLPCGALAPSPAAAATFPSR